MALHERTHPEPVDGCFGCKAIGVGVDTGKTVRTIRHPATPDGAGATVTQHRDGRQDVTVHAPRVAVRSRTARR